MEELIECLAFVVLAGKAPRAAVFAGVAMAISVESASSLGEKYSGNQASAAVTPKNATQPVTRLVFITTSTDKGSYGSGR